MESVFDFWLNFSQNGRDKALRKILRGPNGARRPRVGRPWFKAYYFIGGDGKLEKIQGGVKRRILSSGSDIASGFPEVASHSSTSN